MQSLTAPTKPKPTSTLIMITALVILTSSLILFASLYGLKRNQDTRNQASSGDQASLANVAFDLPQKVTVGQPVNIGVNISTGDFTTTGFQLTLLINTQYISEPTIDTTSGETGLLFASQSVEQISANHARIKVIAIPQAASGSFGTNNTFKRFFTLQFTPQMAGEVNVSVDQTNSKVFAFGSNGKLNLLANIEPQQFMINDPTHQPTPAQFRIADIWPIGNPDKKVDMQDYKLLADNFNKRGAPGWIPADIIPDGWVDLSDYSTLVYQFSPSGYN